MKSIRLKLILIFTCIVLVSSLALSIFLTTRMSAQVTDEAWVNLLDTVKIQAEYVKSIIDGRLNYLYALASNPILTDDSLSLDEKIAFFETEAKRTGYLAFAFVDKAGNSIVLNEKKETTNVANRDYFKAALSGKGAVSDIIISSATGDLVLIYAVPVYKNNEIIGVLYGRCNGTALSDIVRNVTYKNTGYAYMINRSGVTVGHRDNALVLTQNNDIENMKTDPKYTELGELTQKIITGVTDTGSYHYNGVEKMAAFTPVPNSEWIIIITVETDDVLSEVVKSRLAAMSISIGVILCTIVLIFIVSGRIAKPIKKVTHAAQEIANGKFDVTLSVRSKDEIGRLVDAFNETLIRLTDYQGYIDELSDSLASIANGNLNVELKRDYIGQFKKLKDNIDSLLNQLSSTLQHIANAADQVNSGSEQVANGAQALSQGATEQAGSITELSSSINSVSEQIKHNAYNSQKAKQKSVKAGNEISDSTVLMKQMIEAMDDINTKSSEISKIIKIIDDIAFQTNILALNAAVEAARAGAAGKGFAVVADEVRNLASKSAQAAKNTTALIEETNKAVTKGSNIATKTAQSLDASAIAVNDVAKLIDEIAVASQNQAAAIEQVNVGIEQISVVVHSNAATAEESAASSEELSSQAYLLKNLVSRFNLRQTPISFE